MKKLLSLLDVLRKGNAVADPKLWKDRAALAIALSALITAAAHLGKALGYDLGIDTETADRIAGGIAAAAGLFSHYATSDKTGLLPPKPAPAEVSGPDLSGAP